MEFVIHPIMLIQNRKIYSFTLICQMADTAYQSDGWREFFLFLPLGWVNEVNRFHI